MSSPASDSSQPAFLAPARHVGPPAPEHAPATRAFQGIPSLAIAPAGRIWAVWYAGCTPVEDHNNYVVLATSGDAGQSWSERLVIDPDGPGPVRTFDPELWLDPTGRLWCFWAQSIGHEGHIAGVWAITTDQPDHDRPTWSAPRRLTDGVMMCKPLVLSTGEWMLPVSTWRTTDFSARVVISTDRGATWSLRGACHIPPADRGYDEHMVIERRDSSLWMLVRTLYGIGESVSTDRGQTWSPLSRSAIQHTASRFFITRLRSGNLLLVKHGPIDQPTDRSQLTAFLSPDDGRTWRGGLMLDERKGVSYPDGQQSADGTLHLVYDRNRSTDREILMARFREEDILAGKGVSPTASLRIQVSRI